MFLNWGKNEGSKFIGQAGSEGSAVLTSTGGVNGRVASEQSCAVAHGSTNVICKGIQVSNGKGYSCGEVETEK